jgi:hypothetical protein
MIEWSKIAIGKARNQSPKGKEGITGCGELGRD